jgi:predicted MFS family arabinose efflux permease
VIGVIIAVWLLPDTERQRDVRFDVRGSLALALGATAILAGVNQGPRWGWTNPTILALLVVGALSLRWFVAIERTASDPLLPLRWVRTRNIALPILSQALSNFAYMGGFLMAPLIMADVLGYDTSRISLVVIARPLTFAVVAPLASLVTMRIGERATGMFGAMSVVASMTLFAFVSVDSALWFVIVALALSGAGVGIANPALTSLVANAVDDRDLGVAGAMQQLMNQIGAVLGAVVMTTVQQATENQGVPTSYHAAFAVATGVAVVSLASASFVKSSETATS